MKTRLTLRVARAGIGLAAVLACAGLAAGQAFLRGQERPDGRRVVEVGPAGVRVESAAGDGQGTELLTWDRVRAVGGEHGQAAAAFAGPAETLWRARTRVERGDYAGAEPLLEALERQMGEGGRAGPGALAGESAAVVMECLLVCRLARGAQAGAARAYLRLLALTGGAGRASGRSGVIDAATGLVPALPPMFVGDDAALGVAAAAIEREHGAGESAGVAALAGVYALAMRADAGEGARWSTSGAGSVDERAWVIVEIVRARVGDPAERESARGALLRRLSTPDLPGWLAAWCHVAIGRSMVREEDAKVRRRGVLHLLQAPARFGRAEGGGVLASLALREAAETMADLGDTEAATALRAELAARYGAWPAARTAAGTGKGAGQGGGP